jgi:hypothetical protein
VRRDFRYQSPDNDWARVFPQFANAIVIPRNAQFIHGLFSTVRITFINFI